MTADFDKGGFGRVILALAPYLADLSREAANVARGAGRATSAGELATACRLGLSQIFEG